MAFTTWTALYLEMLDDLSTRSWVTKSYQIRDIQKTFTSSAEFMAQLQQIKLLADIESGQASGRTYGKQGGRG